MKFTDKYVEIYDRDSTISIENKCVWGESVPMGVVNSSMMGSEYIREDAETNSLGRRIVSGALWHRRDREGNRCAEIYVTNMCSEGTIIRKGPSSRLQGTDCSWQSDFSC